MRALSLVLFALFVSGCGFQRPMVASPTGDGKYWVLHEDLVYTQPRTGQTFTVPRGFVTDLASIPRVFWVAFPPCGKYTPAAVVHDYLYWFQPAECDRTCADELLYVAMLESHVDPATSLIIYNAVKTAGGGPWDENRELKEQGAVRVIPEKFMNFRADDTWAVIEARIKKDTGANTGGNQ
jgi:hypothetical protein